MTSARRGWPTALLFLSLALGLIVALAQVLGCGRSGPGGGQNVGPKPDERVDPFKEARELIQAATDTPPYIRALESINPRLTANPAELARFGPGPKDVPHLLKALGKSAGPDAAKLDAPALERKLLTDLVGLEDDELREVEADHFTPLDGHYLELCSLLRDAATRSLRLTEPDKDRSPLDRARQAFAWTMRQILLREDEPELQPPEFALRQGAGGPRERALVFLTLLRQADIDGCLIAYPGKDGPVHRLVGVLLGDKGKESIYLFDPRLGLPLPGPGGGVATLAELRKQPELLKQLDLAAPYRYDITPEQARKAEIHLAFPLSALSARMRYLEEEVLAGHERISLALRPARLLVRFRAADPQGQVHVWNRRGAPGQPAPRTPTRVLRQSLPAEQGGIDKQNRFARHRFHDLIPFTSVKQALQAMNLARLGETVEAPIRDIVFVLYQLYIHTPRRDIVRGRFEEASKRLSLIDKALREYGSAHPDDADFQKRLDAWEGRVTKAFAKGHVKAAREVMEGEDMGFRDLLFPDEPVGDRKKQEPGMLGLIIFRAVGELLRDEAAYLQALRWQEKAERLQTRLGPRPGGKGRLAEDAREAWGNAAEGWGTYVARPFAPERLNGPLRSVRVLYQNARLSGALRGKDPEEDQELLRTIRNRSEIEPVVSELRRLLLAHLLLARAQDQSGQAGAGKALDEVRAKMSALQSVKELKELHKDVRDRHPAARPDLVEAMLYGDLLPSGGLHWTAYRAQLEARRLSGKGR
jgi:hypothetical protein